MVPSAAPVQTCNQDRTDSGMLFSKDSGMLFSKDSGMLFSKDSSEAKQRSFLENQK
jgi:hypothetical protein